MYDFVSGEVGAVTGFSFCFRYAQVLDVVVIHEMVKGLC